MGSIILSNSEQDYSKNKEKKNKNDFSVLFNEMKKGILNNKGKQIKKRDVAERLDIDYELFRRIVNRNSPAKHRDCIIAIGLVLKSNLGQINQALLINGFSALYRFDNDDYRKEILDIDKDDEEIKDFRDEELIRIIDEQGVRPRTIPQINEVLKAHGFRPLHILDKRKKLKKEDTSPLFQIDKYDVKSKCAEVNYRDLYNSLETKYHPSLYSIEANMFLKRTSNNQKYQICATFYNGTYDVNLLKLGELIQLDEKECFKNLNDIQNDNEFYNYVLEVKSLLKEEYNKRMKCLYDTKNYKERTSAKLIDGKFHVFSETFNYSIPEWNEYFLLDYCDGDYKLYVNDHSMFMHKYLSEDDFKSAYGCFDNKGKLKVVGDHIKDENPEQNVKKLTNEKFYKELKNSVDTMLEQLKKGEIFIRNINCIYEIPYEVFDFYQVAEDFDCDRNEYGEVIKLKRESIDIVLDKEPISITIEDVLQGFELGIDRIDEIAYYKKIYRKLKNIIK